MLYLAIDQHSKQITVCVRNEEGDTLLRRQVRTRPEKINAFFEQLVAMDQDFMAILEVCGFNDWLFTELSRRSCKEIVLIHPEKPSKKKTDRRDAHKLADLLWLNRERLAANTPVHGLRRVYIVTQEERENRQLTSLRKDLGQRRTRTVNKIHRRWDYPTKTFPRRSELVTVRLEYKVSSCAGRWIRLGWLWAKHSCRYRTVIGRMGVA